MEEIVRAFNYVIEKGWAFYWATSEWTAQQIEEAHRAPFSKLLLLCCSETGRRCDEAEPRRSYCRAMHAPVRHLNCTVVDSLML
jgi:aryl-alcohol dehydrogenase-like predicted oxidoreductase